MGRKWTEQKNSHLVETDRDFNVLMDRIGYRFRDEALLKRALTHSSYVNEHRLSKEQCNERLEFLGDAVLELVSSEFLYRRFPKEREGMLTKTRASLVCEPALADCAAQLSLGSYLYMGRGEEAGGGRRRDSITSDAMEALIGAIYLDGGFTSVKEFILRFVLDDIDSKRLFYDSKTILQEMVQQKGQEAPAYILDGEEGPDHRKVFRVSVHLDKKVLGRGEGGSKKQAEQRAAYEAIMQLKKTQVKD